MYNGYYDNKNPLFFDTQDVQNSVLDINQEDLFSNDKLELVYSALSLQGDIESIKQIAEKNVDVKTFDYDGIKYKKADCRELVRELEIKLTELNEHIKLNDKQIFQFFQAIEIKTKSNPMLPNLYENFFKLDKAFDSKYDLYVKLTNELQFVNYTTPIEQIRANFRNVLRLEVDLKQEIKHLLENTAYQELITEEMKTNFELYLPEHLQYFGNEMYFDKNLETLFAALENYAFLLSRNYFLTKKNLLTYKFDLLKDNNIS